MIYFDTSYIIKCYLNEAGSTPVRHLAFRWRVGPHPRGNLIEIFPHAFPGHAADGGGAHIRLFLGKS